MKERSATQVVLDYWNSSCSNEDCFSAVTGYQTLVGLTHAGKGCFAIMQDTCGTNELTRETYKILLLEAKQAGLTLPFYVYGYYEILQSPNVIFTQVKEFRDEYPFDDTSITHQALGEVPAS